MPPEPAKKLQAPRTVRPCSRLATAVLATASLLLFATGVQAQTFAVLHAFTGGGDGAGPGGSLAMDRAGNLYGAAEGGGSGLGVVFKLVPHGSNWTLVQLHAFVPQDGIEPESVTIGPDGNLYGTAYREGAGGSCNGNGCGSVFKLTPPLRACASILCPWTATVLHRFTGGADGAFPNPGIVFDQAGNLYGTTSVGGQTEQFCSSGCGVVFQLTHSSNGWTENVLHSFQSGSDGAIPYSGVTLDSAGNVYGTTAYGGQANNGTVFKLTPAGSGWTATTLYNFLGLPDGGFPKAGLTFDQAGNLYGTTGRGGNPGAGCYLGCGTVFQLSPSAGGWVYSQLYAFDGSPSGGQFPDGSLSIDAAGNLYGTTLGSPHPTFGNVFELSPSSGGWVFNVLHAFTDGSDGGNPASGALLDSHGNLFGTASYGGGTGCDGLGCGTAWEITP